MKAEEKTVYQQRRKRRKSRGSRSIKNTLKWFGIIFLISFILSAATAYIYKVTQKFYAYHDPSYRPMDTDREGYEKDKSKDKKKIKAK